MFGTMGFSELIIILIIVLIIFGAGRLPQIGEGVGKALKGFRKEVREEIPPPASQAQQEPGGQPQAVHNSPISATTVPPASARPPSPIEKPTTPYTPGPELTPGTTASFLYQAPSQTLTSSSHTVAVPTADRVISMEERAAAPPPPSRVSYPPIPASSQAKPAAKRPSAIVNKEAVARVQAQQAALKAKTTQAPAALSPDDMQHLGEGIGSVVRTFKQAVEDVRSSVDPQMRTIQVEMDAAHKELQQSLEAAKEPPVTQDDQPKSV